MPLVLTFVDQENFLDSVNVNAILSALIDSGVEPCYIRTIADCLRNCSVTLQLFERPHTTPVEKGVTISPNLFIAVLQYTTNLLDWDNKGIRVDGRYLLNVRFAYDIVLFWSDNTEAEMMLAELNEVGKKVGLRNGRGKTQFMSNA